jgi:hypothetical protein
MLKLDTLNFGAVGAQQTLLFSKAALPKGKVYSGIRLLCAVPVTIVGTPTGDAALLKATMKHAIEALTLKYGYPTRGKVVYSAVDGGQLRNVYRFIEQDEVSNDIIGTAYTAGAKTLTFDLFIPFVAPRWAGRQRLPGSVQVETMELVIRESQNATIGAHSRTAGQSQTITVIPVYRDATGPEVWTPLISFEPLTSNRLTAESKPALVLGAWEETATLAATTLTSFDLDIGPKRMHEQLNPIEVDREIKRQGDQGGSFISDDVTPLYEAEPRADLNELPHGKLFFRQPSQLVASLAIGCVFIPEVDAEEAAMAARAGVAALESPVLASRVDVDDQAHPGAAATSPIELLTPKAEKFVLRAGHLATTPRDAQITVPPVLTATVEGQAAAAGDTATKRAVVATSQRRIIRQIAGAVSAEGSTRGDGKAIVRSSFSHHFKG